MNASLFDGVNLSLQPGMNVLVEGDRISSIGRTKIAPPESATVIDCVGRTLMPGMIDRSTTMCICS